MGVAQREGFSASPVVVNNELFFTNDDGETFVVRGGTRVQRCSTPTPLANGRWRRRPWSTASGTGEPPVTSSRFNERHAPRHRRRCRHRPVGPHDRPRRARRDERTGEQRAGRRSPQRRAQSEPVVVRRQLVHRRTGVVLPRGRPGRRHTEARVLRCGASRSCSTSRVWRSIIESFETEPAAIASFSRASN